jgi:hypothetical protein
MVTIVDTQERTNSTTGEKFNVLILQGDVELVQSADTGRFYATARKTSISATFDQATCKMMIGRTLPGSIIKQTCDPYDYTIQQTGEVIQLSHRYGYSPSGSNEDAVFETRDQQTIALA